MGNSRGSARAVLRVRVAAYAEAVSPPLSAARVATISAGVGPIMVMVAVALLSACAHGPARFDPRARRTCLVLSAGGTRGIAELGAIQAIRESRLSISCVVGTSVGALVGGLYAANPDQDTTERFRSLAHAYLDETERASRTRGMQAGVLVGSVAAAISGGVLVPATAALGGYLLGAASISRADWVRLEGVLRAEVRGARIDGLPVPFATLHHEREGQGLRLVVDRSGDLASAIGASIANPFVFDDVDVTRAATLDPGSDRVAATPVQDACRLFPDANLLVVNVLGAPAFYDASMTCPLREIMIDAPVVPPDAFFQGGAAFENAWRSGHDRTAVALRGG